MAMISDAPVAPFTPDVAPPAEDQAAADALVAQDSLPKPAAVAPPVPEEDQAAADALVASDSKPKSEADQSREDTIVQWDGLTAQQIANNHSLDIQGFVQQNKGAISPTMLGKLADAYHLRLEKGITPGDVGEAAKGVVPGLWEMGKGLYALAKEGMDMSPFSPADTGLKYPVINTPVTIPGGGIVQLGKELLTSDNPGAVLGQKIDQHGSAVVQGVEAMGTRLADLARQGIRKYLNHSVAGAPKPEQIQADIADPNNFFHPADKITRLLNDTAVREQAGQAAQGRGAIVSAMGIDQDTLAKQGIEFNPDLVNGWATVTDPTLLLPVLSGLKVARVASGAYAVSNAAGDVLASSATQAGADTALKGFASFIQKTAGVTEGLATAAKENLAKIPGRTVGTVGAILNPSKVPSIIAELAAKKTVEKGAGLVVSLANFVGKDAVSTELGNLASSAVATGKDALKGAAHGAAWSVPFAAAMDDPRDQANMALTGAALGGLLPGAARGAHEIKNAGLRASEIIASEAMSPKGEVAPTQATVLDNPALTNMEAEHARLRTEILKQNSQEVYKSDLLRAALDAKGQEAYFVTPEQMASLVPGGEGKLGIANTAITAPDGSTHNVQLWTVDKGQVQALVHEPGHFWFNSASPEDQAALKAAFSPKQVEAYRDSLLTRNYTDEQKKKITLETARDEMAAEALGHIAEGNGLTGTDPTFRQKFLTAASSLLEKAGLVSAGLAPETGAANGRYSRTGIAQTPKAHAAAKVILDKVLADPEVLAGIKASQEAPNPATTQPNPATPTPAAPSAPSTSGLDAAYGALRKGSYEQGAADALIRKAKQRPLTANERANWDQIFPGIEPPTAGTTPPAPVVQPAAPAAANPIPVKTPLTPATPEVKPNPVTAPTAPAKNPPLPTTEPNVRGKTQADYERFTGPSRQPAADRIVEGNAKVQGNPDLSPEVKDANKTLAENTGVPHDIVYDSAAEKGSKKAADYQQRREEVEAARNNPALREAASKLAVIPLDFSNGQHIVWSGDAALVNVDRVLKQADALKAEKFVPYPMKDGKLVDGGAALADDLLKYTQNQNNGFKGNGEKLNRPSNPKGFIPDENPNYTPQKLSTPEAADFANLLMGEQPPITARKPQAGTVPVPVRASAIADVNARSGRDTGLAYSAPGEFAGKKIYDYNPLRAKMQDVGFNFRDLNPVHERLNAERIKKATPRPDIQLQPTAGDVTAAGFMAAPGSPSLKIRVPLELEHDGQKYKAFLDGVQKGFAGFPDQYQITPQETIPGILAPDGQPLFKEKSTTYSSKLEKNGVKLPDLTAPEFANAGKPNPEASGQFMAAPNKEVQKVAEDYAKEAGIKFTPHTENKPVNVPLAHQIADAYEAAQHAPEVPAVAKAYDALAKETEAQYRTMEASGAKIEPWTQPGQPYATSAEMAADVRDNKHLWYFPSSEGFGTGESAGNPMMKPSGVKINGEAVPVNDLFRAVHDYFGHSAQGFEFGPRGEYNAFLSHSKMYSPEAIPALAAETLGQNSWVNYGKHIRDSAEPIPVKDRPFAEQKATLLPPHLVAEALGDKPQFMAAKTEAGKHFEDQGFELTRSEDPASLLNVVAFRPEGAGEPIASLSYYDKGNGKATVSMAWTDTQFRRKGFQEALYREALTDMQGKGIKQLDGSAISEGPIAIRKKVLGNVEVSPFVNNAGKTYGEIKNISSKIEPDAQFMAKAKEEPKREPTGWILPNGEFKKLDGTYHEQDLAKNSAKYEKDFGTAFPGINGETDRLNAVNSGFARVRVDGNGNTTVEVNASAFGKLKNAIREHLVAIKGRANEVTVRVINNKGRTVSEAGDNIYMARDKEQAIAGILSDIKLPKGEVAKEPTAIQRARALQAGGGEAQFMAARTKPLPPREPIVDQLELGQPLPPVDRYSRAYTNQLTKDQLRDHWPEALLDAEGPVSSDLVGSPLVKKLGQEKAAQVVGDRLVEKYKAATAEGNPIAAVTKAGEGWYSRFAPALRKFFGDDTQLFAEFLAATSPNTNPTQNFKMAVEAHKLYKAGWYDDLVSGFNEGLDKLADGTLFQDYEDAVKPADRPQNISDATLMKWWVESQNLKPTKAPRLNGKSLDVEDRTLFGMSSAAVLKVAARKWMEKNAGPKTTQFVKNLTGADDGATIDVWADRTLREATYAPDKKRWRILPENSAPVNDADFAFGQQAFNHAADKLGIKPSALQGALWFAEKANWAENGWSPLNLGDFMPHLEELSAKGTAADMLRDVPVTKEKALENVKAKRAELVIAKKQLDKAAKKHAVEVRKAEQRQKTLF